MCCDHAQVWKHNSVKDNNLWKHGIGNLTPINKYSSFQLTIAYSLMYILSHFLSVLDESERCSTRIPRGVYTAASTARACGGGWVGAPSSPHSIDPTTTVSKPINYSDSPWNCPRLLQSSAFVWTMRLYELRRWKHMGLLSLTLLFLLSMVIFIFKKVIVVTYSNPVGRAPLAKLAGRCRTNF